MDIARIGDSSAVSAVVRQLQTTTDLQTAIMKQLAEGERQLSDMLQSLGIGGHIDLKA